MSGATPPEISERAAFIRPRAGRRWRLWVIAAGVLVAAAAGAVVVVGGVLGGGGSKSGSNGNGSATSLATVQRRTLSTQTQLNGTLGYAGSYRVLARGAGTVTWLPKVGRVIRQGQVLYRLDGAPVVLLSGSTPAWRALAEGATAGADVAQLNHDLVALGYVDRSAVDAVWREFNWATRVGVERLQHHLRLEQSGALGLGDVAFLPTPVRVTGLQATLGGPAAGQVLSASSTAPTVRVALDPSFRFEARTGDRVTITLPDGRNTPGRVTSVGTVATVSATNSGDSQSGPTVPVTIRPTDPAATGGLDQALVEVAVTDRTVRDVLAVPVDALLARAGGGYSVEVVSSDGRHHLVPIRVGLFDDAAGLVQVSGSALAAGQRVVVPGNE